MSKYFRKLPDINLEDTSKFGGKTASLGEMISNNIPVPKGFGVSVELQRDFRQKDFEGSILREIEELFDELGLSRVAVRSSAVMEDGSGASWAGQLESYLNVELKDVEKAIRGCWKSIEADHIKDYAKDKHVKKEDLLVGVTVQQMVDPEAAGVMFTANPVSQDRKEILIEGLFGLGEMLVQGAVTPDRYTVKKSPLAVAGYNIEVKSKRLIYDGRKNVEEKLPIDIGDKAVLKEKQLLELAEIGMRIEKHYSKPMDVEWAFKEGVFYIVQARPITTTLQ